MRVPAKRGSSTRVELRNPDPSCNPYLAFAVTVKAGLDGIKNRIQPPPPVEMNIFDMDDIALHEHHLDLLPISLEHAVAELEKSELMCEVLGEHVFLRYIEAKRKEWDQYRMQVTPWEIEHYLSKF